MLGRLTVTVRGPGARTAPVRRTVTCGHTGLETTGETMPLTRVKAIGKQSLGILAG
jgi:hypothetical protein